MRRRGVVESGRDRRALVADAGFSQISWVSSLAGVLVAYGAFAVLVGIAAGIADAVDADVNLRHDWERLSTGAALVVAGVLFLAYVAGGYVAGRMARRAGTLHGVLAFVLGVLLVVAVAVAVRQLADTDAVVDSLRDLGVPTTGDEWKEVGTLAGIASLAGMLLGSVLGGMLGERWHAKLLTRALDPDVGAEADARRRAEESMARAGEHHTGSQERVRTASPGWAGRHPGERDDDTRVTTDVPDDATVRRDRVDEDLQRDWREQRDRNVDRDPTDVDTRRR